MTDTPTPQGVVAILTAPDGDVVVAHHFGRSKPGGFTLLEAQKHHAREALAREVLRQHCSDAVAGAIDTYRAKLIMGCLTSQKGYRVSYHYIGYDDA